MTAFVTSVDGTRIAYERLGRGEPVVLVGGMFCERQTMRPLADELSKRFTVINYDRRGRGRSGDVPPYAVEHEVEDLGCLIREAGGSAVVYGHSSGAGLALRAAAAGLPITRLVLHEPPYGSDDAQSRQEARRLALRVRAAIDEERYGDAVALFMTASGMPQELADEVARESDLLELAPTMPYDFEVMGDEQGGAIPADLVRRVRIPTLVIAGAASPPFFRDTATRLAGMLPDGRLVVLECQDHNAAADVVAPVVRDFAVATASRVRDGGTSPRALTPMALLG